MEPHVERRMCRGSERDWRNRGSGCLGKEVGSGLRALLRSSVPAAPRLRRAPAPAGDGRERLKTPTLLAPEETGPASGARDGSVLLADSWVIFPLLDVAILKDSHHDR